MISVDEKTSIQGAAHLSGSFFLWPVFTVGECVKAGEGLVDVRRLRHSWSATVRAGPDGDQRLGAWEPE